MASLGGNIFPPESAVLGPKFIFAGIAGVLFFSTGLYQLSRKPSQDGSDENPSLVKSLLLFFYSCFLKPHSGAAKGGQQGALESFYSGQAGVVRVLAVHVYGRRRLTPRTVRCDEKETSQRPGGHAGPRSRTAPRQSRQGRRKRQQKTHLG
jgi:betaine lipid synthase